MIGSPARLADWLAGWLVDFTPDPRRTILDVVWIMVAYTYAVHPHLLVEITRKRARLYDADSDSTTPRIND